MLSVALQSDFLEQAQTLPFMQKKEKSDNRTIIQRKVVSLHADTNLITTIMTAITINIPSREVSFFKKMMEKMGWTYSIADVSAKDKKPRLYDPETGECLNDKTMKAIEDVHSGKDKGTTYSSFEEFGKAMRALLNTSTERGRMVVPPLLH